MGAAVGAFVDTVGDAVGGVTVGEMVTERREDGDEEEDSSLTIHTMRRSSIHHSTQQLRTIVADFPAPVVGAAIRVPAMVVVVAVLVVW